MDGDPGDDDVGDISIGKKKSFCHQQKTGRKEDGKVDAALRHLCPEGNKIRKKEKRKMKKKKKKKKKKQQ